MVNVTLPDGSVRQFDAPVTVAQVAASIGAGLAKAALAGRVNGELVDTSHVIDADAALAWTPQPCRVHGAPADPARPALVRCRALSRRLALPRALGGSWRFRYTGSLAGA